MVTTLTYKDGLFAADSREMCGDIIMRDDKPKVVHRLGRVFMLTGNSDAIEQVINQWPNLEAVAPYTYGFVINKTDKTFQFICRGGDDKLALMPHDPQVPWACGSGEQFAIAAMDAGATASEAVYAAMKRDPFTGGTVHTYEMED